MNNITQCKYCGKTFKKPRRDSIFCSPNCRSKEYAKNNSEKIKIRRAKHYQEHKERERELCKRWYYNNRESEIEKNRQYRKENKELFDWYHNKDRFNGMRNFILERDNHSCLVCGDNGSNSKLTVHHIDGKSYASGFKPNEANNSVDNLITLCNSCHHKLHWWQRKNNKLTSIEDIVRTMAKVIEANSKS